MKKDELGQFFTKKDSWLTKPVISFIKENLKSKKSVILDPFAGAGNLFSTLDKKFKNYKFLSIGYDVDPTLKWDFNDSLSYIPSENVDLIVTNPPYLSRNSSTRNGYKQINKQYFSKTKYSDLYLIALEKMIETGKPGVAIVPETFINSNFPKDNINKIVVIEPNPFEDTEVPVCVVCFNGKNEKTSDIKMYKNDKYINTYRGLLKKTPKADSVNLVDLRFNDATGDIAIRGIDSTDPNEKIRFLEPDDLNYDFKKIKNSSRAITIVKSEKLEDCTKKERKEIIDTANEILNKYRAETADILLSPFKGNDKDLNRRRRLDFKLARNIIEKAYSKVILCSN